MAYENTDIVWVKATERELCRLAGVFFVMLGFIVLLLSGTNAIWTLGAGWIFGGAAGMLVFSFAPVMNKRTSTKRRA